MDIVKEIGKKGSDAAGIACYAMEHPQCIKQLIEGVTAPKGSVRFGYAKVLRLISEQRPELVYPYFSTFRELSVCDNSFLKWDAIAILSNLTVVDSDNRFDAIFHDYYAPIAGPVMITEANIIGCSAKIVKAKPRLTQRIAKEILKVENAAFENRGEPSPECRNVAIGHAISTLDQIFDQMEERERVFGFVKRQLHNSRKQVVKKAEKFLKKYNIQP
jgi:hypothetical protein